MKLINIKDIPKAKVLAALYNNSRAQGLGHLHDHPSDIMTEELAAEFMAANGPYFDYLAGRVMKVDLAGDTLDPHLYDRDNGPGAALSALAGLGATINLAPAE